MKMTMRTALTKNYILPFSRFAPQLASQDGAIFTNWNYHQIWKRGDKIIASPQNKRRFPQGTCFKYCEIVKSCTNLIMSFSPCPMYITCNNWKQNWKRPNMNQAAHQGPDKNHLPTDRAVQAPHPYLGKREYDTSSTSKSENMIVPLLNLNVTMK